MMITRLGLLRTELKQRSLDAMLVTHLPHIRYLSGFSGSAGILLVTRTRAVFITDFRYKDQIAGELGPDITGVVDRDPYGWMMKKKILKSGMQVGFQEEYTSVLGLDTLKKTFKGLNLVKSKSFLTKLIAPKTPDEIASIRKAANIAAGVFDEVLKIAKPGMRENELANEIGYIGRKLGSEGDAFDIIVASGYRSAMPHGVASTKKMKKGELVTLDFGCIYNGFNSDMTRTIALGKPSDVGRTIYEIVHRSLLSGISAARAGMTGKDLDDVCRDVIIAEGYGEQFGHSTGHGLGIEVHEFPGVSARSHKTRLVPNMVVTIEPGIYIAGECGVRIEDDVVITEDGCTVLTSAPRELIIL